MVLQSFEWYDIRIFMSHGWVTYTHTQLLSHTNDLLTHQCDMITSRYGNTLHITGPLWGECASHRWWRLRRHCNDIVIMFSCHINGVLSHPYEIAMALMVRRQVDCMKFQQQLCHTDELLTRLYDKISTSYHMDELLSHPCAIARFNKYAMSLIG